MSRTKKIIIILLIIIPVIFTIFFMIIITDSDKSTKTDLHIKIIGNTQLNATATAGNGSIKNPYIIENYIINADGLVTHGIWIENTTAYFVIRNCTIFNVEFYILDCVTHFSGAGIYFQNVTNGKIINNTIKNCYYGIHFLSVFNNTIANSSISYNYLGIFLDSQYIETTNNTLIGNIISYNDDSGIYLKNSSRNFIFNNQFYENGIMIWGDTKKGLSNFIHEITTDNSINYRPIYYLKHQKELTIPSNAGQVILVNSTLIKITTCNLSDGTIGLSLFYSNNNTILNNTANWNSNSGIYLFQSSNNTLLNNTANYNEIGIQLESSNYHNQIINNTINYNRGGVGLYLSDNNNTFSYNTVNHNLGHGFNLKLANYNLLLNNTISENGMAGINLRWQSSYNKIYNNTINNNDQRGIKIAGLANYNHIKGNILYGNPECIYEYSDCIGNIIENNDCQNKSGDSGISGFTWMFLLLGIVLIISLAKLLRLKQNKLMDSFLL